MKAVEPVAADTTPPTTVFPTDAAEITRKQYAVAYSSGIVRTQRFLLSRGCCPALAEETAQAAWAKGWEHRAKLREPNKVVSWVNTIALNLYRGHFRSREDATDALDVPIDVQTGPGAIDAQRVFERCIPSERALLRMYYEAGYTSAEIARQMNCPAVTVRVRLQRLRRRIRMALTSRPIGAAQEVA